jgi:hypothetical protein
MVSEAAYADRKVDIEGRMVTLKRGQFSHSLTFIAEAWGWSKSSVVRYFARLKTETMIGTESGTGRTIVTICNYEKYQSDDVETGTSIGTAIGTSPERQRNELEEMKKGRKEKKDRGAVGKPTAARLPLDWVLPAPWGEWAVAEGWQAAAVRREAEVFRDYWHARGAGAAKVDWQATWRNWIRKAKPPPYRNGSSSETPRLGAQEEIW